MSWWERRWLSGAKLAWEEYLQLYRRSRRRHLSGDGEGRCVRIMPKAFILVPGYGAQGGKGTDLVHFFNEDGLGAIVNSSRGIIAAYKQERLMQSLDAEHFAEASRAAVEAHDRRHSGRADKADKRTERGQHEEQKICRE